MNKKLLYGDKIVLEEFLAAVYCWGFVDDDGHGLAMIGEEVTDIYISPDAIRRGEQKLPEGVTHILWFNK